MTESRHSTDMQGKNQHGQCDGDAELVAWQGEWQALGGSEDFARSVVARARAEGRKMRFAAATEIAGAALSLGLSGMLVIRSQGSPPVVAAILVIQLFTGAWLAQYFALRRDLFSAEGHDVASYVALGRKRLETAERWTVFGRRWMAVLGALLLPWGVWNYVARLALYQAEPWRALVGYGSATAIFAVVYAWLGVKRGRTQRDREAFERQIADARLGG